MRASDIQIDNNISMLMKGPFGHAKTLAAASFAIGGDILLLYWDKKKPIELQTYLKSIGRADLLRRIEYEVYGAPNAGAYLDKLYSLSKDCRYFAVITDSVTMLTSGAVNWSIAFRESKKPNSDKKDKIIPDWDEYKVETSLVTQALDICRTLPTNVIWTCHPVPSVKIEGSGRSVTVTKTNPIVTYGSKVAGIVPGQFSEIYHFAKQNDWDSEKAQASTRYIVSFDAVGDDFAKSNLGLTGTIDITGRLFYDVWKEAVKQHEEELNALTAKIEAQSQNPQEEQPQTEQTYPWSK